MISYLVTELGSRTIQSEDGSHVIVSQVNLEIGANAFIEVETGLIISFDPTEFVLISIDNSFDNILDIINPLLDVKGKHLVLKIQNLTNKPVNINQDDKICSFKALDMFQISETRVEVAIRHDQIMKIVEENAKQLEEISQLIQVLDENGEPIVNPSQIVSNNRIVNINPDAPVLNIENEVSLINLQDESRSVDTLQQVTSVNQDNNLVAISEVVADEPEILKQAGEGVITVEQEDLTNSLIKTDSEYDLLSRSNSSESEDMSKILNDSTRDETSSPTIPSEVYSSVASAVSEPKVEENVDLESDKKSEVKPKRKYHKKKAVAN